MRTTFFGHEVSEYGIKNNRVDYATLAKCFDCVLNNTIRGETERKGLGYWEIVNGSEVSYIDQETGDYVEYDDIEDWNDVDEIFDDVYQTFIISYQGYRLLKDYSDELVYYNDDLDIYLWGIKHYGTPWEGVLTDIPLNEE